MNKKLQDILNLIEQNKNLTAEEKESVLKALKDADKELEITAFKLERTEKIKKTTAILLEETIEELEQKQKAVEAQNRELEIETALEKVRSSALAMKEPAEMVGVCRIISDQLQLLGVKDIRNVQTAIINEQKSTYLNYQYFTAYNKSTIELAEYNKHPKAREFAETMKKSANAFYSQSFDDEELGVFREYRKQDNQFPDPILDEAASLHFYFYSIGPGALGISTYNTPLSESGMNILKRFRNVFELAYRRFTDIELAITQARESKIEAALEKVRAVAMSMNKPDDLLNVCEVLFKEFYKLGFDEIRNAMINIHNDDKKTFLNYDYSDEIGKSVTLLNFNSHPVMEKQINQSRLANDAFSEAVYKGKDLEAWKAFRRKYGEKDDPRIKNITALYYYFYSIGNGTIGISTFTPVNEEKLSLLKRFRNVFSLSYQRYSDIALAEAQAKESQIQLALERVRARTMAMHHSDELAETAYVLFQQFKEIDKEPKMITIGIMNEKENVIEFWVTDWSGGGSKINQKFHGSTDEPTILNKIYKAWENGSRSIVVELAGKNLQKWVDYRVKISGTPDDKDYSNEKGFVVAAFFSNGILSFSIYEPVSPETIHLLERFAGVFDITYTRFLDLQKAEAQAREAQIELGLERVRARAMAMQKSEELSELVDTVFKELTKLDFALNWCIINIINEPSLSNTVWAANPDIDKAPESYHMKFEDYPFHHAMMKGYQERRIKHVYVLEGQEKKIYDEYLFNETEFRRVPAVAQTASRAMEKYVVTFTFSNFGGLQTVGETPLSDANLDILSRFGKVFDLTYTRFNDLKLAEGQAREAQIETSLERVRAVAMSMNKSEDLLSICEVAFNEFQKLGFNNLRNAIIHILNDEKSFFLDYDYSEYLGGSINSISYNSHPIVENYLIQIKKADDAFAEVVIEGNQLDGWKDFRRRSGQLDDPRLDKIPALYYYLYSIGVGDIGISTFKPIEKDRLDILKRFRNVFNLSYQRYSDIAQAEAQAREAKIEAALEKVRSRSMGMQKSEELKEVIKIVYQQLTHLKIKLDHSGFVVDYTPRGDWHFWIADERDIPSKITHPYFESVWANQFDEAKEKGVDFFTTNLNFEEKNKFYNELLSYVPGLPEASKEFYLSCPGLAATTVLMDNVGLYIENFSGIPFKDEENNTLMRFGKVFQQTYTRFLDLQKAEAQARESQIETALERVRSRTMAMHQSSELAETASVLFKQLIELGVEPNRLYIAIVQDESGVAEFWITDEDGSKVSSGFSAKLNDNYSFNKMFEGWKKKNKSLTIDMQDKELREYFEHLGKLNVPFKGGLSQKRRVQHIAYFSQGFIGIASPDLQSEETVILLERFAAVFNLTYRRFLDLQKAEAQAKEAQIELALERVRAKTMAMQNSNELVDTSIVLFHQLKILGVDSIRTGVATMDEVNETVEIWSTSGMSGNFEKKILGVVPAKVHPMFTGIFNSWKNQDPYFAYELKGDELKKYYRTLSSYLSYPEQKEFNKREIIYTFFFPEGSLNVVSHNTLTEDECNLTIRFAKVFGLVYRRFLDLKLAEAQTREAQIEVALEKVRGKAMAMHTSSDISETMGVVFSELPKLGIGSLRCGVALFSKDSRRVIFYAAANALESDSLTLIGTGEMSGHPEFENQYEYWLKQENYFVTLSDEGLRSYYEALFARLSIPYIPKEHKLQIEHGYYFPFSEGMFYAWAEEPYSENEINVLNRFKVIFDLTFRRYLDLQKAEAQAREAKIEVSLERVRSKAMAMHSPNDLSETVNVFFKELKTLRIIPIRCGVGQIDGATRTTSLTTTTSSQQGDSFQVIGKIKQTGHPVLDGIFDHWKLQKEYHPDLQGEDIKAYYDVMNSQIGYPEYPEGVTQYGNCFFFKEGFVFAWTESKLSEEQLQIFRRFTSVLSLTYRRYIDLKEAEIRAFEAVRQASLDRVRAEIASMRSTEDLNHITPIIWRELKTLEVPFFRCGVFIVDEANSKVQVYLTTPDGRSLGVLYFPIDSNELTSNTVEYWKKKKVYKEHWNKEQFIKWTMSMIEQGQVKNAETYQGSANPPDSLDLHFVPFTQGMLYVGDTSPLAEDKLQLVKTLAGAFSIAYARYEDFKLLEEAKNRIEVTFSELKSAQVQLIHSEKMASLGELTAGIAHEIKNPLNFVNNFSEISSELLDEMKTELENKNNEEVIELIENLKQNLEKINQHGKRADAIVKGMLLHSRGSSGEKTLTDVNDLLDQYVTLAYHGLRAQDKEFNITIEKTYDETLEKVNVVPQDISRVFLNIINNACYAAYDRKKKSENDFNPVLKVSTKNLNGEVEIRIGDNGSGIPAEILDKIFQPFFTTKPTGEGTGLGLSLSYDIVTKVHGGELKVETKEGEGSNFIISIPRS